MQVVEGSKAIGDFLRARREQLRPADLGVAITRRRRTPGLRREEVAELAGISTEWLVKLEQGRAGSMSETTFRSLVRTLRLSADDEAHLRLLTRASDLPLEENDIVPEAVIRLVSDLADPAYVTGRRWDLLAWNAAANELFGGIEDLPTGERNVLKFMLSSPKAASLFGPDWEAHAQRMVAAFRTTYDLVGPDPSFETLLGELNDTCPQFAGWWRSHRVRSQGASAKLLRTDAGTVRYDYAVMQVGEHPFVRLSVYMRRD